MIYRIDFQSVRAKKLASSSGTTDHLVPFLMKVPGLTTYKKDNEEFFAKYSREYDIIFKHSKNHVCERNHFVVYNSTDRSSLGHIKRILQNLPAIRTHL